MSESQVVALLGKPKHIETGTGFIVRTLVFPRVRIDLDEDGLVAGARSSSSRVCLGNSVCPGASEEETYAKLPELRHGNQALNRGEGCWAEVEESRGRIKAVAIVCQP